MICCKPILARTVSRKNKTVWYHHLLPQPQKRTDDALTLFSKSQDTSGIVVPGYQYFVEKFNEMVMRLKEVALYPESVDTMQSEDDQKKFVITFRELTKYLQSLQTFIEFSFDQDALIMSEQEYQDYKSKYLMLYSRQKLIEKSYLS